MGGPGSPKGHLERSPSPPHTTGSPSWSKSSALETEAFFSITKQREGETIPSPAPSYMEEYRVSATKMGTLTAELPENALGFCGDAMPTWQALSAVTVACPWSSRLQLAWGT